MKLDILLQQRTLFFRDTCFQLLTFNMNFRKNLASSDNPFRCFNSSPEMICLVLMYGRFPLSPRNIRGPFDRRGIVTCRETLRLWWIGFGPIFAGDIGRQRISRMRGLRH